MLVPANASAQLIKVAQPETIGAVDDDGVGVWDIKAALDNRSREQHICFAVDESGHHFLKLIAVHLAVTHHDAGVRQQGSELLRHRIYSHDPIVQKKDLAAAVELTLDRVAD